MEGTEQAIKRKKRYIENQETNIRIHQSYIQKYNGEIEEIEKCKCLKDLRDYSNSYAYNGEKYLCYDIGEGGLDFVHEFDTFDKLKEHAKHKWLTFIEHSNREIKHSQELIGAMKTDIEFLKRQLFDKINNI